MMFPTGSVVRRRIVKYGLPLLLLALLSTAAPLAIPREGGRLSNNHIPPRTRSRHMNLKLPAVDPRGNARGMHIRFTRQTSLGTLRHRMPTFTLSLEPGLSGVRPFQGWLFPGKDDDSRGAGPGWRHRGHVAAFGPPTGGGSSLHGGGGGGGDDDDDDDDDDGPPSGDDDDDDDHDDPPSGDDDDDDDDDDPPSGDDDDDDDDDDPPSGDDDDDDDDDDNPPGGDPVPEPATVLLALIAGGAFAVKRVRRLRTN